MATTYRARRLADGKEVALKIPHQTGDPTYLPRFLREGRLGETLHHPGIVRILEAGQEGDVAFLAMELVPGRPLKEEIEALPEGLPLDRALEIARAIAEALDYAHSKGVVHRDLKPENIMLLPDGSLKVMDFGVARVEGQPGLTTSQFFFGSPLYAAPELVEQPRTIDHRADLYSLGVLLYELLEGRPPFLHESIFKLLEMHQREPLPEPGALPRPLPPEVWALVGRLLEKDPARRYDSAQELLVDLNRWLHGPGEQDRVSHGAAAAARAR
jgi:serine/threonine-protein kinase